MKKALLVQPGAYGDIIICAPIAHCYSKLGYEIFWPTREKFKSLIKALPYVNHISLSEEINNNDWLRSDVNQIIPTFNRYDLVLNLADRGPHDTAQLPTENFEHCKYRISNVPFNKKHQLEWARNLEKENELYFRFVESRGYKSKEYIFTHTTNSHGDQVELPFENSIPRVECEMIENYSIFDWYRIIENAKEVYCVESAIHQFIDGLIKEPNKDMYLLKRSQVNSGTRFTHSIYWNHKYIGNTYICG